MKKGEMAMKSLILCVDDEQNILELLTFNLEASDFATITATNGTDALAQVDAASPSLILLDLMLPDMSGMDVCKAIKAKNPSLPIIMLTAKDSETDKVLGLELGADDYITKPFSVRELTARIKALLRRAAAASPQDEGIIRNGSLTIDPTNYEAFHNGEKIQLTLKEFELLKLLAQNIGRVVTRDFLLDRIWGYEFLGETRTVDVHIRHIRTKLGDMAYIIETVRGIGYKMVQAK